MKTALDLLHEIVGPSKPEDPIGEERMEHLRTYTKNCIQHTEEMSPLLRLKEIIREEDNERKRSGLALVKATYRRNS